MIRVLIALVALIVAPTAQAGLFSSEPPSEFLGLKVGFPYGGEKGTGHTLGEFAKFLSGKLAVTWDKQDDDEWILKTKTIDKMKGEVSTNNFLFVRKDGMAFLTRMVSNGKESPMVIAPNIMLPMMQAMASRSGKSLQVEAGDSYLDRPILNERMNAMKITGRDFDAYYRGDKRKVSWRKEGDGVIYFRTELSDGMPLEYAFREQAAGSIVGLDLLYVSAGGKPAEKGAAYKMFNMAEEDLKGSPPN